jgi:hypothetical protein
VFLGGAGIAEDEFDAGAGGQVRERHGGRAEEEDGPRQRIDKHF